VRGGQRKLEVFIAKRDWFVADRFTSPSGRSF
jgi:hypothetical protein